MSDNQPSGQPAASDSLGLKPGEIFWNHYRIINIIGKGGVSTVYKAENTETKQFVAIKLLHAKKTRDEELVRRFIREAQTTTKLIHPHAIHIWEWGIDQMERPFMVIEFLAGETLSRRIQKGNGLNYNKALEIMEQICAAIQEAHSLGIVHRDLKPDNIMLTMHQGVADWVKVCDFGIAKLEPGINDNQAQATLTQAGAILGTPMYMSPEQLRGRKADARSDIYSLGCIMYEMLTGKPPFTSRNTAEIVVGHLNQMPEAPHKVRMDLNIPEKLSLEVMRALAKNPWERPTTVQTFITNLRKVVEKPKPVAYAHSPSAPQTTSRGTIDTPVPYGMVIDPAKRVCFRCKTVASGGSFRFCLKCGQDNSGKWLPYHAVEAVTSLGPLDRIANQGKYLIVMIAAGIVLAGAGYVCLSKPNEFTGRFVGKLDHQLFSKSDNQLTNSASKPTQIEMILSEEAGEIQGMLKTPFGDGYLTGKSANSGLTAVSYNFTSLIARTEGNLNLELTGTYNKIFRSYDWLIKAQLHKRRMKPVIDQAKMILTQVRD